MRKMMMNTLMVFVLLAACGTLQGCIWWSHTGGRNESIGTDSTSGYIVVTRKGMTEEQAMEKAKKVITGWAPLDLMHQHQLSSRQHIKLSRTQK